MPGKKNICARLEACVPMANADRALVYYSTLFPGVRSP